MNTTMNTARLGQLRQLHDADPADADVCYMIAQELGKMHQYAQAIEWYDKCIAADAAYCYAYYFKAIALDAQGRRDDAMRTILTGLPIAERSDHPKAFSELCTLRDELRV